MITKCDLCKKEIKKDPITAGVAFFPRFQFCDKCGAPIFSFLKKKKLIEEDKIKKS